MDNLYRLQKVFREVFEDPAVKISEDTSMNSLEDWDSVATVSLILEVESEFGIRFTTDEVAIKKSDADIINVIEKT